LRGEKRKTIVRIRFLRHFKDSYNYRFDVATYGEQVKGIKANWIKDLNLIEVYLDHIAYKVDIDLGAKIPRNVFRLMRPFFFLLECFRTLIHEIIHALLENPRCVHIFIFEGELRDD